ncbi:MAG: response regulator [Candidatus Thermoplasmatota archaeon]
MTKKIMVVDDNLETIYTLKEGLEDLNENYSVYTAKSGEQCLELLKEEKPDLILLDIMMPGISGWETYDKIKENSRWQNIPVVFLTARSDNIAKNAGRYLGHDYIEKPFDIEDLNKRISKIIG